MDKEEKLYRLIEKIEVGSRNELLALARSLIGKGGAIYTPNPIMLFDALENPKLYEALMRGVNIPDGVGVAPALSRIGKSGEVLAGVELARELISGSDARFAVIGGKIGRAEAAGRALEKYGGRLVLALDGYSYGEGRLAAALDIASPDIAFICYGSPKQELFIDKMRGNFEKTLFLGLGGSVDIYSGAKRRAPLFWRKMRLEWLWRMICEPRRFLMLYKILGFLKIAGKLKKFRHFEGKNGKKSVIIDNLHPRI